ncbi:MAG: cytochrome D1 domain-containing protein [Balneolaceae bacterium]|nr:cytochrome D1 domain-containing protein [Balneolaceae bacterium]
MKLLPAHYVIPALILLVASAAAYQPFESEAQSEHENGSYLLVLNKSADTAWQLEASTGKKVAEYPTKAGPHEVAVSPDQTRAALTNYGAERAGSTLTIIDLNRREVEKVIDLGAYRRPHGIQWFSDGRRVIVSAEAQQAVAIVDVDKGAIVKAIRTDQQVSHMVELSPDEQRVYVPNIGSNSVTVIDLQNERVIKEIPTGEQAEGITLADGGREVWVTNRGENTISVIDTADLKVVETLRSRDFPIRAELSPNGEWVAVSNARSGDVALFDAGSREPVARVSTNTEAGEIGVPIGLIFSSDSSRLYVANSQARQVVVIETGSWRVIDRFRTGDTPDGIAYFTR